MSITKSHIFFSLSWIKRLVAKNDFNVLEEYVNRFNTKLQATVQYPFPDRIWNEILHYYFMMELGATLQSVSIVLDYNHSIVKLISEYDNLSLWINRLQTASNIGTLDQLPNDILWCISDILMKSC